MKKLMDIFFEDEEEEIVVEAPMSNIERKPVSEEKKVKSIDKTETIQNKDLLAKRPHSKSFGIIDVEELQVKKHNNPVRSHKVEERPYESMPPISPIFGIIKDSEENVLKTPQMTPGPTTCLGTILSPIYGHDIKEEKEEVVIDEEPFDYALPKRDLEINRIISNEEEKENDSFENASLEEILKHEDETYVAEQEFSLFDDIEDE